MTVFMKDVAVAYLAIDKQEEAKHLLERANTLFTTAFGHDNAFTIET